MDGSRFDGLTRVMTSARSRRHTLAALAGLALVGVGEHWRPLPAAAKPKKGKNRKTGKKGPKGKRPFQKCLESGKKCRALNIEYCKGWKANVSSSVTVEKCIQDLEACCVKEDNCDHPGAETCFTTSFYYAGCTPDAASGLCYANCLSASDCAAPTPHCVVGKCVECEFPSHCPDGPEGWRGACDANFVCALLPG